MPAPTISGISPAPGPIDVDQSIHVEVYDNGTPIVRTIIALLFPGMELEEVVWDGSAYTPRYATLSTTQALVGGVGYTFLRDPVWPDGSTLKVWSINSAGQETTSTTATWVLANVPTPPEPTIVPVFPGSGSAIATDTVFFNQSHFLSMFERILASNWLNPIRANEEQGAGYELLRAFGDVGERVSIAIERLERGLFAIFAEGGAKATGVVEFYRPTNSAGAVTVLAGTVLRTSKNGRQFVTLEDAVFPALSFGPITAPVAAIDYGWEYNVKGQVITARGDVLPGEIDTVWRMYQKNSSGQFDFVDPSIRVRQVLDFTGGREAMLDAIGQDKGILRGQSETDERYRFRVRSLPDTVSPDAILTLIASIFDEVGLTADFIETFEQTYQEFYDAPTLNVGEPTFMPVLPPAPYDENLFVFDDPRPTYPFINRWLDEVEQWATFIVVVPLLRPINDSGGHFDSTDVVEADRATTQGTVNGWWSAAAFDVDPATLPSSFLGTVACFDGGDPAVLGFYASLYDQLNATKAAGVVALLELRGE